jgi:hypothetical protein
MAVWAAHQSGQAEGPLRHWSWYALRGAPRTAATHPPSPAAHGLGPPARSRIRNQVVDGPGDQHLPGAGGRHDPRGQVHRNAADIITSNLHLIGVEAGPDLDSGAP